MMQNRYVSNCNKRDQIRFQITKQIYLHKTSQNFSGFFNVNLPGNNMDYGIYFTRYTLIHIDGFGSKPHISNLLNVQKRQKTD